MSKDHEYLYPYSSQEAKKRNQLSMWRESYHVNVACRNAIEETIRQNFDGMHLKKDCLEPVLAEYGYKRTEWVLATTLQELSWDGRFSRANKQWAARRYDDVYHAVREGYAAGWYPDGTGRWDESVDTGDVYGQLASTLGLENTGSGYQKISNGNVEYTISGLSVELSNNALSSGQSKGYTAAVEIRLEVPVRFLGNLLPAAEMMLHTEAKYVPVF